MSAEKANWWDKMKKLFYALFGLLFFVIPAPAQTYTFSYQCGP
jgi:hypothetical protein